MTAAAGLHPALGQSLGGGTRDFFGLRQRRGGLAGKPDEFISKAWPWLYQLTSLWVIKKSFQGLG